MRKIRTCKGGRMNTGSSACKIDWKFMLQDKCK